MDPVTVVSVVGLTIEFVEFAKTVVQKSHEIYKSVDNSLVENNVIEEAARRASQFTKDLEASHEKGLGGRKGKESPHYQTLQSTVMACAREAKLLADLLEKLKPKSKGKWVSMHQAVCSELKKKDIRKLEKSLGKHQKEVMLCLLGIIKDNQQALLDKIQTVNDNIERLQGTSESGFQQIQRDCLQALRRISAIPSADRTDDDIDDLSKNLLELSLEEKKKNVEQMLIDSLFLPKLEARYNRITKAHKSTFEWIYNTSTFTKQRENDFSRWLREGSESYWITGKPGAGKSTLMKFILGDERTRKRLKIWSGESNLVVASFFFWLAGSSEQRSQLGLLRFLFYEMLTENRSLVAKLFPWRWRTCHTRGNCEQAWEWNEFQKAITILKSSETQDSRFCFFIDGLDEFQGDPQELIRLVKDLSSLPNVKLCISSRPWPIFVEAFQDQPRLEIHELTAEDIARYTRDELKSHDRWARLYKMDCQGAQSLITEISSKSSGVFLWVYYVTRRLRKGLTKGDNIRQLQKHLMRFPPDLEAFFTSILERWDADEDDQEESRKMLQIAAESREPLLVLTYAFLQEEADDPDFGQNGGTIRASSDEIADTCQETVLRLNSQCQDLLEVYIENGGKRAFMPTSKAQVKKAIEGLGADARFIQYVTKVDFLHRTVLDYLCTSEAQKLLAVDGNEFDASSYILEATIALLRGLSRGSPQITRRDAFNQIIRPALSILYRLALSGAEPPYEYIDKLGIAANAALDYPGKTSQIHWTEVCTSPACPDFFILAIVLRLGNFLDEEMNGDGFEAKDEELEKLLSTAISPPKSVCVELGLDTMPRVEIVSLLLEHGADPFRRLEGRGEGAWDIFESRYPLSKKIKDAREAEQARKLREMLLAARITEADAESSSELGDSTVDSDSE